MSETKGIRDDLAKLKEEWLALDPTVRLLDLCAIGAVILFAISYLLVSVLDIVLTVTNAALLIFPVLIAGYIYVYRGRYVNENVDNDEARKEFFMLTGLTIGLVLLTIVYSLLLDLVL